MSHACVFLLFYIPHVALYHFHNFNTLMCVPRQITDHWG